MHIRKIWHCQLIIELSARFSKWQAVGFKYLLNQYKNEHLKLDEFVIFYLFEN